MSRRTRSSREDDNGFEEWGGYMAAKKAKLAEQYNEVTCNLTKKLSSIFSGIAIFVNGYTTPSADELKYIMAAHGGVFHLYQRSGSSGATTHIIASNLPNVKIKQLGSVPIVKPNWITDSITAEKLLDYRKYLLYTNQGRKQPTLDFPVVTKPPSTEAQLDLKKQNTETDGEPVEQELDPVQNLKPPQGYSESKSQGSRTLTAADPRFLAEFYSNSRLHLISTLGAEYKQLVCQLRDKSDGKFPGRAKLRQITSTSFVSTNESVVMHIDMDCFFVSVGLRSRPDLRGQPVAVTHARNAQGGVNRHEASMEAEFNLLNKHFPEEKYEKLDARASMAEIASCSYEARKCGVRNGMFLGAALKLCPNLQTIAYNFQGYREVSTTLYHTIAAYTLDIEAVSCDEMYVDITPVLRDAAVTVEEWSTHIRKEIMEATGCPCSTGFGANRLQARLATKKAKPAGQFHLKPSEVEEYMATVILADLPGVGHATVAKLTGLGLETCGDVQVTSLSRLQAELGQKAGETLLEQARGIDRKPLNFQHERKSVSADVNYGIRFKEKTEALNFLQSLSAEVCTRLQDTGMRARCLTLKLLVRAPEAPQETAKFLGCGVCNAINRSTTTGGLISDSATIYREAKALFERANVPPVELRGVGIQLTRLEKAPPVHSALSRFLQQNCEKKPTLEKLIKENPNFEKGKENDKKSETSSANQKNLEDATNTKHNSKTNATSTTNQRRQSKTVPKPVPTKTKPDKPSKRGRPKGSTAKSTKSTKKPTNDLNNYFKRRASTPLPEADDVDLNVLNELPEDLRQEIIKEYRLENRVTPESSPQKHYVARAKDDLNRLEEEVLTSAKSSSFDGLEREELKPIIMNWLNSEREPADIDVTMIGDYLRQLAINRKIEDLKIILSFLYRHVTKLGLCSWHEAYLTIVNTAQEGMVARYGSTLLVERHFLCALHL